MKYVTLLASLTLVSSFAQAEPARLAEVDLGGITAGMLPAPEVNLNLGVGGPTIPVSVGFGTNVVSASQVPVAVAGIGHASSGGALFPYVDNDVFAGALAIGIK
jgi:hypothetical protein